MKRLHPAEAASRCVATSKSPANTKSLISQKKSACLRRVKVRTYLGVGAAACEPSGGGRGCAAAASLVDILFQPVQAASTQTARHLKNVRAPRTQGSAGVWKRGKVHHLHLPEEESAAAAGRVPFHRTSVLGHFLFRERAGLHAPQRGLAGRSDLI